MQQLKRVLVTNDDGVDNPGLEAIAVALQTAGYHVTVCAPDRNWSACGHVKTLTRPMHIRPVNLTGGMQAFACDGAPSDCVSLALMGALDAEFDFVVSGINPHNNIGMDITYSGTVTAAFEAALAGLPGYAVSYGSRHGEDNDLALEAAANAAVKVVGQLLGLKSENSHGHIWNINLPFKPHADFAGVRFTHGGVRIYADRIQKDIDSEGETCYWITGEMPTGREEAGNEYEALQQGFISVCPLRLDMTDTKCLARLRDTQIII
ncbi:MAG TPA: 5'/3'-nucleotidase SurE [Anaerolineaceae bacterium]|nr:5'/3'-nucleotidase SurE [Anaerolineaceae bacterium]